MTRHDFAEMEIEMGNWFITAKKADFAEIAREFDISPVLARLIRNRDIVGQEDIRKYLRGTVADMYDPFLLLGMNDAVCILAEKIAASAPLRIIGDYDADGICAACILFKGLRAAGGNADTVLPHRVKDGYGLNENLISEASEDGIDTVITCDNGIAAAAPIALAKEKKMTVIVTDHHEAPFTAPDNIRAAAPDNICAAVADHPHLTATDALRPAAPDNIRAAVADHLRPTAADNIRPLEAAAPPANERIYQLPPADAIVNPKQPDCPYPFKQICGATVALKVIEAFFIYLKKELPEELHEELRCLAAIATVCDVMELKDENRVLVKYGLARLRSCRNLGLRALLEVSGIDDKKLTPYHIGFIIGPCLNATGRLDTAERALGLLQATDYREAAVIAGELKSLNESRKEMTVKGVAAATQMVEEQIKLHGPENLDAVLVLYLPDCHESLAGIIAGRIRERYHRPAFILTGGEGQDAAIISGTGSEMENAATGDLTGSEGQNAAVSGTVFPEAKEEKRSDEIKGSGRSIDAYHMYDELCKCRELFTKFGGHKLAAGLSMPPENREKFRLILNQNAALTAEDFREKIQIDIALPLSYVTPGLIRELELLEPFGMGNPKPVFAQKNISLLSGQIMGKTGRAAKYKVVDEEGRRYEILHFGDIEAFNEFLRENFTKEQIDLLYKYPPVSGGTEPPKIRMTYYADLASYRGQESMRIVMQHYDV